MSQLLIVVDDSGFSQQLANHYGRSGYQVHCADNPSLALQLLKTKPIHLILLQYHTADATIKTLFQEHGLRIPVVLLTCPETAADVLILLRLGATDVFELPLVSWRDLDGSIDRQLQRAQLSQENLHYRQQLQQAHQQMEASLAELRHDQQAGYLVQQGLMPPQDCRVNGLHIQRVMKSSLYLSGDFVDHICISPNHTLVYLADVSGHGASSAFLTVLLKNITHRLVRQHMHQSDAEQLVPARLLNQINRELMEFNQGKHITIFMGLVDLQQNRLTYCVGGHLPMPILSQQGASHYLPGLGSGLPLGLFEDAAYLDLTVDLKSYFSIMVCSDGVLEILPNDTIPAKESQLLQYLQQMQVQDPVADVSDEIGDLCHLLQLDHLAQVPDDIAVLNIKRDVSHG